MWKPTRQVLAAIGGLVLSVLLIQAPVAAYEVEKSGDVTLRSLEDFELCIKDLANSTACLDGLVRYGEKRPRDAFQAGKRARLLYRAWTAVPLFDSAFAKQADRQQCKDEDVALALTDALQLPPANQAVIDKAKGVANKCWEGVKDALVKYAQEDGSSYFRANACPLMIMKGMLIEPCQPRAAETKQEPEIAPEVLSLKGVQWRSLKLDQGSAMVLRGAEDEQVLLVRTKGQDDLYVVKFKNIRGAFNNQVFVARERPFSNGRDYVGFIEGREWLLVTTRNTWPGGVYESYPKGYTGLRVFRGALVDQAGVSSTAEIVREFK